MGQYLFGTNEDEDNNNVQHVIVIGLENAGKSSVLYRMQKSPDTKQTNLNLSTIIAPTKGNLQFCNLNIDEQVFNVCEVGGSSANVAAWRNLIEAAPYQQQLVLVVDSTMSTKEFSTTVTDKFKKIFASSNSDLQQQPLVQKLKSLLVLLTKSDCLHKDSSASSNEDSSSSAIEASTVELITAKQVSACLNLQNLLVDPTNGRTIPWHILSCSAKTGEGIKDAIACLASNKLNTL